MKKPMNAVSVSVTVHMTWADETKSKAELVKEATELFTQYVTNPEGSLHEDYAPPAWGGYDGPWLIDVKASQTARHYLDDPVMVDVEDD